jgi:5-(carboxyamino)imidazole ribonucleotide synthase
MVSAQRLEWKVTMGKDGRIGILGGGQLGRMLIQSALNLDLTCWVMDPDPAAPCRWISPSFQVGDFLDYDAVLNFGRQVDRLTIEIETVDTKALRKLEEEGIEVFPRAEVIEIAQDKGCQKGFFRRHAIPTAPYHLIESREELQSYESFLPAIQKLRRLGYDGRGVYPVREKADMAGGFDSPSVLEQWIDFEKEIAVIVVRNRHGEKAMYSPVEMVFVSEANLLDFLVCPAELDTGVAARASELAAKVAEELEIVGVMAVEMFLTSEGDLLVNEIAPRVHNSGHHTIEGAVTSQFEQHLRVVMDWALGEPRMVRPAVLVNLLGEPGFQGAPVYEGLSEVLGIPDVHVHLYGKAQTRPFRKMGHVTVLDQDVDGALEKARRVRKCMRVVA